MTTEIVARAAAFARDAENACLVAGFSEFDDGSGHDYVGLSTASALQDFANQQAERVGRRLKVACA